MLVVLKNVVANGLNIRKGIFYWLLIMGDEMSSQKME
jgi:hypothetical protein